MKVAYKKDAKENLHYTTVADRPDIKKATQAAKQASEVGGWLKCCQPTMHREQVVQGPSHLNTLSVLFFFDSGGVQSQAPQGRQPRTQHAWSPRH